jgi:hypothetical protein
MDYSGVTFKGVRWLAIVGATCWTSGAIAESPKTGADASPVQASATTTLADSLSGQAKIDYEAARLLYQDGDAASALVKFQAAYELARDPHLLWNLAACQKQLRHYAEVEALLRRFLLEGGDRVTAADRSEATALLETIAPFLADVKILVSEQGADAFVDDGPVGRTPLAGPVRIALGRRRLRVEKKGFVRYDKEFEVKGGGELVLSVALRREVHEGRLRVFAGNGDQIGIDGRSMGLGAWLGTLPSGPHLVEVTAPGKLPYRSDVVIVDQQTSTLRATLESHPQPAKSVIESSWFWTAGAVVLAAGLGIGGYFAFKPDESKPGAVRGSLDPGQVQLPLGRR